METPIEKLALIINNGLTKLSKQIEALANKKTPAPNIEVKLPDNFKVNLPPINYPAIPAPIVHVPKQDTPIVNVPAPIVNMEPNITVQPTPVEFPKEMEVKGFKELGVRLAEYLEEEKKNPLEGVSRKKPIPMILLGKDGEQITEFGSDITAPSTVSLRTGTTLVSESNPLPVTTDGFAIPIFDTQIIDEALAPTTTVITYKKSGVTVATKTITVSGTTTTITVT